MKLKKNLIRLILICGLLAVPVSTVYAQSSGGDVVIFGQNYTLASGDSVDGSLAIFGGNATIEKDATVNGDAALFGGNVDIAGEINGDMILFGGNMTISGQVNGDVVMVGGNVTLTETAVVDGNVTTVGGNVDQEEGAEITGEIIKNAPPNFDIPDVPNDPNIDYDFDYGNSFNPVRQIGGAFGQALVIAAIGMLLMLFLQPQLERAGNAMTSQPFIAGGFGLLTIIAVPVAIVIMAITILLIPVAIIVAFLLPLAWLFGIVALGQEVGERFTKAINQTWAPVLATGFGTFMLVLLTRLIGLIPCVGWFASTLVYLVALGGVAMTWFGTRNTASPVTSIEPPATT